MKRHVALAIALLGATLAGYWWAFQNPRASFAALAVAIGLAVWAIRRRNSRDLRPSPSGASPGPELPTVTLDSLESASVLVNANYAIVSMNAAALDAFGEHPPGEDIRVAIRHPAVIECMAKAMRRESEPVAEIERLGRGSAVYRLRVSPAGDERFLMTFADISQARLSERMRADFVANASHELRTPLATLVGFIETLQGPAANDEAARARFLDVMAAEAARMTRLIDDLLSLSRIELDKNIRPRDVIALRPLLDNVAATSAVTLGTEGRTLSLDIAADLPDVVADRDQILQVLHNLVTNAVKYGRKDTPITIAVRPVKAMQGDAVRIAVEDVGDGIAAEHIPRLTERFYRVDTGRSRRLGGTGLGLAIVKHIVERHRGTLEIQSEVGKGTSVAFTLPAALSQN